MTKSDSNRAALLIRNYGMALLSIIPIKEKPSIVSVATSMTVDKKELRERVARIGAKPKTTLALTLTVLLCVGVGIFALAACTDATKPSVENEIPKRTITPTSTAQSTPSSVALPVDDIDAAPEADALDNTDMAEAAKEFFTAYFDTMCLQDVSLVWHITQQTGLDDVIAASTLPHNERYLLL